MRTNVGRVGEALEQLLPFLIIVGIVTFAFLWFIQRPLSVYLQSRTTTTQLQTRLATLEDATARAGGVPGVDLEATLRQFAQQVSPDDKVADVAAILAKAVLDYAPKDMLREFSIATGERVSAVPNTELASRVPGTGGTAAPDPRLGLFPFPVSYTPVRLTFASTYDAIAAVMWRVRDLPTLVEVRSATLTRGLPLMKVDLLLWVYQRGEAELPSTAPGPSGAPASPPSPAAPRVARLSPVEGW